MLDVGDLPPACCRYAALIRLAAKSGEWLLTRQLFARMRQDGLRPNVTICNSMLFALRLANQLDMVFDLFHEVRPGGEGSELGLHWWRTVGEVDMQLAPGIMRVCGGINGREKRDDAHEMVRGC